ncbi:MAG: hypothetical protein AB1758_29080, partial [Candidatus Eremiobacterota bacterium]
MEVLLALLVFLLALSAGSRTRPGILLEPQAPRYTEKASRAEMRFAGLLQFAGVGLVVLGLLHLLRVSGSISSGWFPCLLGLATGLGLT